MAKWAEQDNRGAAGDPGRLDNSVRVGQLPAGAAHAAVLPGRGAARKIAAVPSMTRPFDPSAVERIWLRAPNWLGDFVMATAAFARIRAAFPNAHITAGMRPYLRPLVDEGLFDEIVATPKASGLGDFARQVRALRQQRHDLAIVLPNSWITGAVPFFAGIPLRLGYRQGRPLLMNLGISAQVR